MGTPGLEPKTKLGSFGGGGENFKPPQLGSGYGAPKVPKIIKAVGLTPGFQTAFGLGTKIFPGTIFGGKIRWAGEPSRVVLKKIFPDFGAKVASSAAIFFDISLTGGGEASPQRGAVLGTPAMAETINPALRGVATKLEKDPATKRAWGGIRNTSGEKTQLSDTQARTINKRRRGAPRLQTRL